MELQTHTFSPRDLLMANKWSSLLFTTYSLSLSFLEAVALGLSALIRIDAIQVAEDALRSLVDRAGDTGMLCIWSDRGPIAIRWRRGRTLILSSVGGGTTFPLLGTVSGHVFLAFMPSPITRPLLEAELAERAARGNVVSEAEVADLIARVRTQRYSAADGHIVPEMRAMSRRFSSIKAKSSPRSRSLEAPKIRASRMIPCCASSCAPQRKLRKRSASEPSRHTLQAAPACQRWLQLQEWARPGASIAPGKRAELESKLRKLAASR